MSKELFISSSPHETKVAVLDDEQLVEVYYERDTDVGLVGGIYKGRVSRVLPGMQSAFVDIGLERDAFLYVSDFFLEDQEEYEKVFEQAEARATRYAAEEPRAAESKTAPETTLVSGAEPTPTTGGAPPNSENREPSAAKAPPTARPSEPVAVEGVHTAMASAPLPPVRRAGEPAGDRRPEHRGRRRRHSGRGFIERKFYPRSEDTLPHTFEILPGESLAKYSHTTSGPPAPTETVRTPGEPLAPETVPSSESEEIVSNPGAASSQFVAQKPGPKEPSYTEVEVPEREVSASIATEPARITPAAFPTELRAYTTPADLASGETCEPPPSTDQMSETGVAPVQYSSPEPTGTPRETQAHAAEVTVAEEGIPSDVHEIAAPAIHRGSPPEVEASPQTPLTPANPVEPKPEAQPPDQAVQTGGAAGSSERTYTLREPYQRPRHALRRGRRGRRGMGDRRPPRLANRQEPLRPGNGQTPQISQLLKEGQEILVQIAKEPLGSKGARITSHVALPGRYLVYLPTIDHIGVSRKIASEQERLRLRNIILENKGSLTGGFIVRTAGQGRSEEEFRADLKFLSTLWSDIKAKTEQAKGPALIHRDLNLVQRILRDTLSPDFKSIRVDNETEYERVVEFVSRCQPSLAGHVKLYSRDTPLFEEFGIEAEIEKALIPKVWLKSGGYIVINQTEALVAIDVNTGKFVGKTNRLEDTILKTNIDAVNEIVRQIRLRDLGGIIVIDFIDMDERRNRFKVAQALEEALRHDRAPTKVISFHDFGLVAVTRKRVKQSLERTLCEPCDYCSGAGWIKSPTTVCYEILAEASKMANQIQGQVLNLRVNPEVAHALKSREGMLISELESITHKDVIIKSDPTVHQERFEIF